ncbi:HEPN domain-containing protein [Patescibacteria group bacterium]|nr:HEPN domain-containing protein [Patescibacteria group bacterium]
MKNKLFKEWIIKAQNDLETAQILFREKGPTDTLCFHCHQAVEKYLKAFLIYHQIEFEKIHDLWKLTKDCAIKDKEILKFEKELKILNGHYIESRYPPEITTYSQKEIKKVLKIAEEIAKFIADKIIKI